MIDIKTKQMLIRLGGTNKQYPVSYRILNGPNHKYKNNFIGNPGSVYIKESKIIGNTLWVGYMWVEDAPVWIGIYDMENDCVITSAGSQYAWERLNEFTYLGKRIRNNGTFASA